MFRPRPFAVVLQELQLTNLYGINKQMTLKLIETVQTNDKLFKLKLSRVNLNDTKIIEQLCRLLYGDDSLDDDLVQLKQLYSLDLSWTSLQPKHLLKIA